jgi:hypothetical protein
VSPLVRHRAYAGSFAVVEDAVDEVRGSGAPPSSDLQHEWNAAFVRCIIAKCNPHFGTLELFLGSVCGVGDEIAARISTVGIVSASRGVDNGDVDLIGGRTDGGGDIRAPRPLYP